MQPRHKHLTQSRAAHSQALLATAPPLAAVPGATWAHLLARARHCPLASLQIKHLDCLTSNLRLLLKIDTSSETSH